MKRKLDPIALLLSIVITLAIAILAALTINLNLNEITKLGFFGFPIYSFMFYMAFGFPVYLWVNYLRKKKEKIY